MTDAPRGRTGGTIGFVDTGKIAGALVRGLASAAAPPERISVSPRNAQSAAELARELPSVCVAAMTQCLCELRVAGDGESFRDLAAEAQAPGGLDEQAARIVRTAKVPAAYESALDALLRRFETAADS